jgi:probable phosphoglycerate mutase
MRIHVIRHGQSEVVAGISEEIDCPLTPLGLCQAGALASALAAEPLAVILSSPFRRCLQTAEVIRRVTGSAAEIDPALHEHHHAPYRPDPWPLPAKAQLAEQWPEFHLPPAMPQTRYIAVPEDREHQWRRVNGFLTRLLDRFAAQTDARVAVVTHGAPATAMVQAFCQWTNPLRVGVRIDPGTISTLEVGPDGRRILIRLNCQPDGALPTAERPVGAD